MENALWQTNILGSFDMMVLQSFVLYLVRSAYTQLKQRKQRKPNIAQTSGERNDEHGPDAASLVGLATGIAVRMGLHCDGAALGLPPFQVEMRRRLWWQLVALDVRVADDRHSDPCILESSFDTQFPCSVNDASLDPELRDPPQPSPGRTEMLFSLVQFEVSRLARQLLFSPEFQRRNFYRILSHADRDRAIGQLTARLEKQYLVHCDTAVPLDAVLTLSTRLALEKLTLTGCQPCANRDGTIPVHIRPRYLTSCVRVLQQAHELRATEKGRRWLWFFRTSVEWDALAYLLLCLATTPSLQGRDTAWKAVRDIYDDWSRNSGIRLDQRWSRIESLYSRASNVPAQVRMLKTTTTSSSSSSSAEYHSSPTNTSNTARRLGRSPNPSGDDSVTSVAESACGEVAAAVPAAAVAEPGEEEMTSGAVDMPSTGTGCEWSTELLRQYFDVDSR